MPSYTVTPAAGSYVAGRRARLGEVLELTEFEARAEVIGGALVLVERDQPVAVPAVEDAAVEEAAPQDVESQETAPQEPAAEPARKRR